MLLSLRVHLTPREKLDDLLMVALSGDTMTAIKFTTEIIGSGVEPQALMSQLASLIKDLLSTPATVVSRSPSAASGKVEAQPKSFSHQTKNFNSALSDLLKSRRICSGKPITENYQKKKESQLQKLCYALKVLIGVEKQSRSFIDQSTQLFPALLQIASGDALKKISRQNSTRRDTTPGIFLYDINSLIS